MDRRQLDHLCGLAKLSLTDEEIAEFERKFAKLLGFVEQIQSYEATSEGNPLTMKERVALRPDTAERFTWPDATNRDYKVPRIIDFEGGS